RGIVIGVEIVIEKLQVVLTDGRFDSPPPPDKDQAQGADEKERASPHCGPQHVVERLFRRKFSCNRSMDLLESPPMQLGPHAGATRGFYALGSLVGVVAFTYLLAFPRALGRSDESIVLYGAVRVLQGQVLYQDFF